MIIGDYLEPRLPRDHLAIINRLIEVLDSQELAAKGYGLKVVK
jgi:hypothetical protein